MNLKIAKTFFFFLFLLTITSFSKNAVSSKSFSTDSEKHIRANTDEFVVLLSGDTIRFEKIKFKNDFITLETVSSEKRKVLLSEISCIQTREFFVLYNVKNTAGRLLYRMTVGKINVYYTLPNSYNISSAYYGSNGNFNYAKTAMGFSAYFFEKEKGVYESINALQSLKSAVSDYAPALTLFNTYYPIIKDKLRLSDKKLLDVINKYNEGYTN